ncbi:hypothetical protein EII20_14175 [Comamonadaceae bacterium OH2545_COT-014]|nr:hypothetical protein EII20_14175 [Comamonadaceae bacterium OH2545_COT-014]
MSHLEITLEEVIVLSFKRLLLLGFVSLAIVGCFGGKFSNLHQRDKIFYSAVRLHDYLLLAKSLKESSNVPENAVHRLNLMIMSELAFVERDLAYFQEVGAAKHAAWICRSIDELLLNSFLKLEDAAIEQLAAINNNLCIAKDSP